MELKEKYTQLNTDLIRKDFPILSRKINNNPLIYFDNGATTQKPKAVVEAITNFYYNTYSNIHRGVHTLSRESTEAFENARKTVAEHFGVTDEQQFVFTSGTTDSLNLIVNGLSRSVLEKGDEIIVTAYEHHSNILPWQLWAEETGGKIKVLPLNDDNSLNYSELKNLVSEKTKVIAITHVSNTLGLLTNLDLINEFATKHNLITVIDGAQSAPHMPIDLSKLNPDFFVCSAHKIYGPTGTGILYMNEKWLRELPVSKPGGGTIKTVSFEKTEYAEGALRFEPGTPNIEGVIGFAAALDYMNQFGMQNIYQHESELVNYAQEQLLEIPEVILYGKSKTKAAVISFNIKNQHPFDVGTILDKYGIAVRTGHHCTQPLMALLCVPGTIRISFGIYNTKAEIDFFIEKLKKTIQLLS
jgi:cysteine desulfurase / selenocysteine lyase